MFPSISFPLGSIGSFNAGALRSTVVTRFNATTAPSDSCPNIRPGRSPKFLCRTIRTRHPTLPRHAPPFRCTILVQGRVLASCHLKHWPHGTCVTRLYPWIHFRYGSYICEREASPCRSPFTMPASLLMQWSIHKANTFQFASSAKLCLAHQKVTKNHQMECRARLAFRVLLCPLRGYGFYSRESPPREGVFPGLRPSLNK